MQSKQPYLNYFFHSFLKLYRYKNFNATNVEKFTTFMETTSKEKKYKILKTLKCNTNTIYWKHLNDCDHTTMVYNNIENYNKYGDV